MLLQAPNKQALQHLSGSSTVKDRDTTHCSSFLATWKDDQAEGLFTYSTPGNRQLSHHINSQEFIL